MCITNYKGKKIKIYYLYVPEYAWLQRNSVGTEKMEHESHEVRLGDEERRLMHLVPAPADRDSREDAVTHNLHLLLSCSTSCPTLAIKGVLMNVGEITKQASSRECQRFQERI